MSKIVWLAIGETICLAITIILLLSFIFNAEYCGLIDDILPSDVTDDVPIMISVNDKPTANNDVATVYENSSEYLIDVLENDDSDGNVSVISVDEPLFGECYTDGRFIYYIPPADYGGVDRFSYVISDGHDGTDMASIDVTILSKNSAPVAVDDAIQGVEGQSSIEVAVLDNDWDGDGDALTIFFVTDSFHGVTSTDGSKIYYTPDPNFIGIDQFDYVVRDGEGGTDSATVDVMITSKNRKPVAADDFVTLSEDSSVFQIDILGNDGDVDGDHLFSHIITDVSHGILAESSPGVYLYTPKENYHGTDFFTYRVDDGQDTSEIATVTISILPMNDPPVGFDDEVELPGNAVNYQIDVLSNDVDIDCDILRIETVEEPLHGVATTDGRYIYYTPECGYEGRDRFNYTFNDGNGANDSVTIDINITPVELPLIAVNDSYSLCKDQTLTIQAPGVLVNDIAEDKQNLIVILVQNVSHGILILQENGSFRYIPDQGYVGIDQFTYKINDSEKESNIAVVTIKVTSGGGGGPNPNPDPEPGPETIVDNPTDDQATVVDYPDTKALTNQI